MKSSEDQPAFLASLSDEQREMMTALLALKPEQIRRLGRIALEEERREWLFAWVRKTAAWVFGIVAALVVFRDNIAALFYGKTP